MPIIAYNHKSMEAKVVELWNSTLHFDLITVDKFRKQIIFDENFNNDLCYVYCDEDQIIGFILATKRKFPYFERGLEPDKAWINVLFVDTQYRNQGVGEALLATVEDKLINMGVTNIILGAYSPNYFFPGLDIANYPNSKDFFECNGYVANDKHYSMSLDLHGYQISKRSLERKMALENLGYRFQPFTYDYSLETLDFLRDEFDGGWKRNALVAMQKGKAEERLFIVLNPEGKICGVANRAIDDNEMRFGPIGISQRERNNGIGTVLFECAVYEMTKRGIYHMFFMTTDENGKRYYDRMGLKLVRTYTAYSKKLSSKT